MQAYRSAILSFNSSPNGQDSAVYEADGLLVVGPNGAGLQVVKAMGSYQALAASYPGVATQHLPGRIIAPGFVDMHIHYPQQDIIASPAAGLLPWLENYTFPEEKRYAAPEYCAQAAAFFIAELLRNGVTTALTFCTSHPQSVNALMLEAQKHHLRLIAGKVLMDQNAPDSLLDQTGQSLLDTEALIHRWHGKDRLGYAITPRFVPTSSAAQLRGAGELAAKYPDVWVQSHVAENADEIAWVQRLYPAARSYLSVYEQFGLLRPKAVYAHCIHLDNDDRALMAATGTVAAVCPTSNLFLGSGFFDYLAADRVGHLYGLASDVGGGTSFSPFHTMLAAYYVGREGRAKPGISLTPQHLWWQHTAGAAAALGLAGVVGSLQVGSEADFVVLNPQATPLLARKTARAQTLDELLFALIALGDDRVIEKTVIAKTVMQTQP